MPTIKLTQDQLYELNDAAFEVIKRMLRDGQDDAEIKLHGLRNLWSAFLAVRAVIFPGPETASFGVLEGEVREAIANPKRMD